MSKAILLHSGGLDSSLLGVKLANEGADVVSVFVHFGQNAKENELAAVRKTTDLLGLPLEVLDASGLRSAFTASALSLMRVMPNPGKGVLPLGSLLLYGPAMAYANQIGARKIYVGLTKLDADFSPEYSESFLKAYASLASIAGCDAIEIEAPFLTQTKGSILQLASSTELATRIVESSWSCVHSNDIHCGSCEGCRSRKVAFSESGMEDKTLYAG